MSFQLDSLTRQDPVAVVQSCHTSLRRLLEQHRGRPIRRLWIDHPYGEEELALLEEELLPAIEQFLARTGEIDATLEAARERSIEARAAS